MSALARFAIMQGKRVGGSDRDAEAAERLRGFGVKIFRGGVGGPASYDAVVYTDAVGRDDADLRYALSLNKPAFSRAKFLAAACAKFADVTAVAGAHGKTTCTAMLASIFYAAGKRFSAHIGGNSIQFSNFCSFGNDCFITEACEYKKNFLLIDADTAVILNTDADHLECYRDEGELLECYRRFAFRASNAVVACGALAEKVSGAVTFGTGRGASFRACNAECSDGCYSFELEAFGKTEGRVSLSVPGKHNVHNALAAAAASYVHGISFDGIMRGLEEFEGVERRMQLLGNYGGARCVADYAHHPTEIAAALKTAGKITEGKLFVVFQPHTYSRTKNLFAQFVAVLSRVHRLLIYRTYAAREYFDEEGCAFTLARAVRKSRYGECAEDITKFMSAAGDGDTVLFLGAGDIYDIAKKILSETD